MYKEGPLFIQKQQKIQSIYFELVVLFLSSLILALTLAPDNQHRLAFQCDRIQCLHRLWSFSLNFIFPFGVSNSIPSIFLIKVSTSVSPFVFFKASTIEIAADIPPAVNKSGTAPLKRFYALQLANHSLYFWKCVIIYRKTLHTY